MATLSELEKALHESLETWDWQETVRDSKTLKQDENQWLIYKKLTKTVSRETLRDCKRRMKDEWLQLL